MLKCKGVFEMLNKIKNLIDVKSIVTLVLVLVLALLVVTGTHPNENVFDLFKTVMTMVITYFFTKKSNKESGTDK
jgi:hypothetical protein